MTYLEAVTELMNGKQIRYSGCPNNVYFKLSNNDNELIMIENGIETSIHGLTLNSGNMRDTTWEVK